jgi:hypothetical protein
VDAHSHGSISDDPVKFREAVDEFLSLVPMTDDEYAELEAAEQEFAFTIANVTQADLVGEVYEELRGAIENGTDFGEFQDAVAGDLAAEWGGENPARVEAIFRTSVMDAYNSGRYDLMTAPATADARPYWRYDGIDSDGRTCDICEPCIGTILPADDEWWLTHYPILHPNCRDIATALSADEAEAEGISDGPPDGPEPPAGFGTPPSIGGSDWEPDPSDYPDAIGGELADKLDEAA